MQPQPPPARGSHAYALRYADDTIDAYQAKFSEEFLRQQKLSNGLLTLGALATGAAIGKAHSDVFITMALSGGLAYQLGTWNSSQGRLPIYVEGIKAVGCAKSVLAPLFIDEAGLAAIAARAEQVHLSLTPAAQAAGETTRWLAVADASVAGALATSAATELADLDTLITRANELLNRAAGMPRKVNGAAAQLDAKVDEIRRLVDSAINGTLADLANLPKVIGSLGEYANVFAPGLDFGGALKNRVGSINTKHDVSKRSDQEAQTAERDANTNTQLAQALGTLRAQRITLAARLAELEGTLGGNNAEQVKTDLAGCGVDNAKLSNAISLDRTTVTFTAGAAATAFVTISGGTLPYSASLLDVREKGITIAGPAGGAVIVIQSPADAKPDQTYQIRVTDAAKATAMLTVMVNAATPAPPTTRTDTQSAGNGTAPVRAACSGFDGLEPERICLIQKQLRVGIDGDFGKESCAAFRLSDYAPQGAGNYNTTSMNKMLNDLGLGAQSTKEQMLAALTPQEKAACEARGAGTRVMGTRVTRTNAAAAASGTPAAAGAPTACAGAIGTQIKARTPFECGLTVDAIRTLRVALGLPAAPAEINAELRNLLANNPRLTSPANKRGEIDEKTMPLLGLEK